MIVGVYAMRDRLSGYLTPTFEQSDPLALRHFAFAMQRVDSLLNANPADYDLYRLAQFDSESGEFIPCVPALVASGISVIGGKDK